MSRVPSLSSSVSALSPVPSLSKSTDSVASKGNTSFVSGVPSLSSSVSSLSLIPSPSKSTIGSLTITSSSSIEVSSNNTVSKKVEFSNPKTDENSIDPSVSIPIDAAALNILVEPNAGTPASILLPELPTFIKRDEVPVNDEVKLKPSTFSEFKLLVLANDKLSTEATCVSVSSSSTSSEISSTSSSDTSSDSLTSTSTSDADKEDKVSI